MTINTWYDHGKYKSWLLKFGFNEDQIEFLIEQRDQYETAMRNKKTEVCPTCGNRKEVSTFDYDSYEREMWYTMNRSGLFEDVPENKTGIKNWGPNQTRRYITEVN